VAVSVACLAVFLAAATVTPAATVTNQRPLLFSFDGSGTTAGRFALGHPFPSLPQATAGVGAAAVDYSSEDVYVVDNGAQAVDKFDAEGAAANFAAGPAAGTSSLFGPKAGEAFSAGNEFFFDSPSDLAVDNSGGTGEGEQGRLYVSGSGGPVYAFDSSGELLPWSIPSTVHPCGIAVDHEGHVWIGGGGDGEVHEFEASGEPALELSHFAVGVGNERPCRLAIGQSGEDVYVALSRSGSDGEQGVYKYSNGLLDAAVTGQSAQAVAVNQEDASGPLFAVRQLEALDANLDEYETCASSGCAGTLIGSSDGGLIGNGRGVAYGPGRDWVYVPDLYTETVKVFGPRASGLAPDAIGGDTDEIAKTEATAHGTLKPNGLPNAYRFEWVRAEVQRIQISSTGGTFVLETRNSTLAPKSERMPFDISAEDIQAELESLYGAGNVSVTGTAATDSAPGEFRVVFGGALAGRFVARMSGFFVEPFEESEPYKGGRSLGAAVEVAEVGKGQLWAAAEGQRSWPESEPSIEPPDNADHAVSKRLTGLRANTTYDVRLVGTNTEPEGDPDKRLDVYSNADTFTTLPPDPATVADLEVTDITKTTAHLTAAIDSQEDETIWRVLVDPEADHNTTQQECEGFSQSKFEVIEEGSIPQGEGGANQLETDLDELNPGEIYCLRLVAVNGNPEPGAESTIIHTEVTPPSEVKLAFVAPRTDTSARLNFYANPEGEAPLTYRLEYSLDGVAWTPLDEVVSTVDAHSQVVFGEEATNLTPQTTYRYRLALVENEAGKVPAASLNEEGIFTTRSSEEMSLPPNAFGEAERRGFELVNNPDKGGQNARAAELYSHESALRSDGEEFLWTVVGGAPGANSGTQATFLAARTASGWTSRSLLPPASEQVGGGSLSYYPVAASPGFSSFIFAPAVPSIVTTGPPTFVRLGLGGSQQVLHSYQSEILFREDVSSDIAHVLIVDPDTRKLEDIGSGTAEEVDLIPQPSAPAGVPQPGGSPPACGLNPSGGGFIGPGEGAAASQFKFGYHRMSITDASRVYFQTHPNSEFPSCGGGWTLYVRNREATPPTTTAIVTPAKATSDTAIIRATPDGRSAYFVTSAKLDSADKNTSIDIYRWDEAAGKSTCLTCGVENENGEKFTDVGVDASNASRVLVSDDFSHVYFDSPHRLVPGTGTEGGSNLYVLSGGKVRFVAGSVRPSDSMSLSTNGNVLTFLSGQPLTADRTAPSCPDVLNGGSEPCRELYRYDDRDGSIECLSCSRDALTTNSVSLSSFGEAFKASIDGSTVAFVTAEALLPRDGNGSADLYEWRNGALRLLTDGVTHYPVGLAGPIPQGIDPSGSNIIFSVASPGLTGFERDGVANLYDARLGGGFTPPNPPAHCSEETCQGPLQGSPPITPFPSSTEHRSARPSCRRGRVRHHGRCVKKRHGKHHRNHRRGRR
jgi:DNA-binding beta-propeller fold protein YncE